MIIEGNGNPPTFKKQSDADAKTKIKLIIKKSWKGSILKRIIQIIAAMRTKKVAVK